MPLPIHRPIARRRLLIALGAGALAASFSTLAQQPGKVWRIGFLEPRSRPTPSNPDVFCEAFTQGMRELGYVEGKNLLIEWHFADGKYERFPGMAAELVRMKVDVIVTQGTPATEAAQRATRTIPIVTVAVGDPIRSGFAASLAHPGGNITGLSFISSDVYPKQLEMLKAMLPRLSRVAVLVNPSNSRAALTLTSVQAAAKKLGVTVIPVDARTPEEIERGFATMRRERADAVIVHADSLFNLHKQQVADLAARSRMPSSFVDRSLVEAGGLMSYGQNVANYYQYGATYVDKILKGAKPGELPFEQPTKIYLAINRKTAKALGITIPQELLIRADEVIE